MMLTPNRSYLLVLGFLVLFAGGCTKRDRMERHLAAGDRQIEKGNYDEAEIEYRSALQFVPGDPVVYGRLGTLFFKEGRIVPGYGILQQAIKEIPNDPDLLINFAYASQTLAKTVEARNIAKKVLELQPANEEAVLLLAGTCTTMRDNEESRLIIEKLREKNKDVAAYHVALGELLFGESNDTGAEAEFHKALELDPKSSAAYAQLGNFYFRKGDLAKAGEAFKTAAGLCPPRSPRRLKYLDFLIRSGAVGEAKSELAKITTAAPDYLPGWNLAMRVAFAEGKYDESDADAQKILDRERIDFDALMQRAVVKRMKGDTAGEIADLKRIAGYYEKSPVVRYQLAVAYLKKGERTNAEESLYQAILLSPSYEDAILMLANINLQKVDLPPVVTAMTNLLRRNPENTEAYLLLSKAYRAQGDFNQTLVVLRALAELAPKSAVGPYLIGSTLMDMNRREEGRKYLEQSIQVAADYWPAHEALVDADLQENHRAEAAERVRILIGKYPKAVPPLLLRAKLLLTGGDTTGAEADLLRAIELEPKASYPYVLLARIYFLTNRNQEALDKLTALVAKEPNVSSLMQLGMLRTAMQQYEGARQAYLKLLSIDPQFVPALNNLADLYSEKLGQLDKGYTMAKRARELDPVDPQVADSLGWIQAQLGQLESGLVLLKSAAEGRSADPIVEYHLGSVYYLLGEEDKARQALEAATPTLADPELKAAAAKKLATMAIDPASAGPEVRADLEKRSRLDPNDPVVLLRVARIEIREGAAEPAAAHLEALRKLIPRSIPVMLDLVKLYAGPLQKPKEAKELAKTAHDLSPHDPQIARILGELVFKMGEPVWAADLFQAAAHDLPNQPVLIYDLARAKFASGQVPGAAEALTSIVSAEIPAAIREPAEQMAAMIGAADSPELALGALPAAQKILATTPDYLPALNVVALAQEQQRNFQGARDSDDKILALAPFFAPATRRLAILYSEHLGDDLKAEQLAIKALASFPDDPILAFELGSIKYRRADFVPAVRFFQQSLRNRPDDAETIFFLGMSQYQLKNLTEGKAMLERALQLKLPEQESHEATRVLLEISRSLEAATKGF